jgi:hypothetical protein
MISHHVIYEIDLQSQSSMVGVYLILKNKIQIEELSRG